MRPAGRNLRPGGSIKTLTAIPRQCGTGETCDVMRRRRDSSTHRFTSGVGKTRLANGFFRHGAPHLLAALLHALPRRLASRVGCRRRGRRVLVRGRRSRRAACRRVARLWRVDRRAPRRRRHRRAARRLAVRPCLWTLGDRVPRGGPCRGPRGRGRPRCRAAPRRRSRRSPRRRRGRRRRARAVDGSVFPERVWEEHCASACLVP